MARKSKNQSYKKKSKRIAIERKIRTFYRRMYKISIVILLITFFASSIWLGSQGYFSKYKKDISKEIVKITENAGLTLQIVYIEGLKNLNENIVRSVLPSNTQPLFSLSLEEIKKDVESIGWIESAEIRRKLPNELHIKVKERVPSAIWQYEGNLHLIDKNGIIISYTDIKRFSNLPIIVGEEANIHAFSLLTFLTEEPDLMKRVSSIIRVGGRRWNVRFKNGIEVKLPEANPDIKWRLLSKMQKEKRILDRVIKGIDLRDENAIYIIPDDENA